MQFKITISALVTILALVVVLALQADAKKAVSNSLICQEAFDNTPAGQDKSKVCEECCKEEKYELTFATAETCTCARKGADTINDGDVLVEKRTLYGRWYKD